MGWFNDLPSGKLTVCYWTLWFMVDLAKHGDSWERCKRLPGGYAGSPCGLLYGRWNTWFPADFPLTQPLLHLQCAALWLTQNDKMLKEKSPATAGLMFDVMHIWMFQSIFRVISWLLHYGCFLPDTGWFKPKLKHDDVYLCNLLDSLLHLVKSKYVRIDAIMLSQPMAFDNAGCPQHIPTWPWTNLPNDSQLDEKIMTTHETSVKPKIYAVFSTIFSVVSRFFSFFRLFFPPFLDRFVHRGPGSRLRGLGAGSDGSGREERLGAMMRNHGIFAMVSHHWVIECFLFFLGGL